MMIFVAVMAVLGFLQGILITRIGKVAIWLERLIFNESRPRTLSYALACVLGWSPILLPLVATKFGLSANRAFFVAILLGGLIGGRVFSRKRPDNDHISTAVALSRVPAIAVFGRFANEDKQMEDFLRCLRDRGAKKLWREFESIPVDLDEDGAVLSKYGVDPKKGLQSMFFRKDGTRIDFDGSDRVFAEDMLDPRRFESRLQAALNVWNAS